MGSASQGRRAAECERWVTTPACCVHSLDPPPFGQCAGRGLGLWLAFAFFVVTNPANSNWTGIIL